MFLVDSAYHLIFAAPRDREAKRRCGKSTWQTVTTRRYCDQMQRMKASELRPGDRIEDLGVITRVFHDDDLVIFYVHEQVGGFTLWPASGIEVERDDRQVPS